MVNYKFWEEQSFYIPALVMMKLVVDMKQFDGVKSKAKAETDKRKVNQN